MDHETAGDPVRGLKWTRRTTAKVAAELCKLGTDICARTVARLLKKMGFSLRVNHKKRAGASHPNRDDQFQHIAELRERCAVDNTPVISVDTKKKELVGAFKNAGAKWDHSPHASPHSARRQITPKTSRYTRCSISMLPNVSINGRIRSSGQLGRWWYSINPCRNNECVRRFTVFAFNHRS